MTPITGILLFILLFLVACTLLLLGLTLHQRELDLHELEVKILFVLWLERKGNYAKAEELRKTWGIK